MVQVVYESERRYQHGSSRCGAALQMLNSYTSNQRRHPEISPLLPLSARSCSTTFTVSEIGSTSTPMELHRLI